MSALIVPSKNRRNNDAGSILPLLLGCFLLAFVMVAGAVAAGDAFVDQQEVQSQCDSAAAVAANTLDLDAVFSAGSGVPASLPLGDVQAAVNAYRQRDPSRSQTDIVATRGADALSVTLRCSREMGVAFGGTFGKGTVVHVAYATARSPLGAR